MRNLMKYTYFLNKFFSLLYNFLGRLISNSSLSLLLLDVAHKNNKKNVNYQKLQLCFTICKICNRKFMLFM